MAFGIEGRYPYLDHRIVEFALTIPPQMGFHRGWTKRVMRATLGDVLPSKDSVAAVQEWIRDAAVGVAADHAASTAVGLGCPPVPLLP